LLNFFVGDSSSQFPILSSQSSGQPYDNEIFCIETDPECLYHLAVCSPPAIWDPEYYWSEPFGSVSLDGRFFMFSLSWDGRVGLNKNGDPRSDIWIVKLD
jgi:hypothetical protein